MQIPKQISLGESCRGFSPKCVVCMSGVGHEMCPPAAQCPSNRQGRCLLPPDKNPPAVAGALSHKNFRIKFVICYDDTFKVCFLFFKEKKKGGGRVRQAYQRIYQGFIVAAHHCLVRSRSPCEVSQDALCFGIAGLLPSLARTN